MRQSRCLGAIAVAIILAATLPCEGQQAKKRKKAGRKAGARTLVTLPGGTIQPTARLATPNVQNDFPAMCVAGDDVLVSYIAFDGKADRVKLARLADQKLAACGTVSETGNAYQPSLACDGKGRAWCVWSQMVEGKWVILARTVTGGNLGAETVTVDARAGNAVFPHAAADRSGRVWATWQVFEGGAADIYAAHCAPGKTAWSKPVRITKSPAGDWEPRLAFGAADEALIVFDSYRGGTFDVFLARVSPAGKVAISPIAASPRYEARAQAATSPDGKTLWVAYEDGTKRWGKDLGSQWRKAGGGLNYDRHAYVAKVDLATGKVTRLPDAALLIPGALPARGPNSSAVNVPTVAVDAEGNPWLFLRFYAKANWHIAVSKFDLKTGAWTQPRKLGHSAYCQDRRVIAARRTDGTLLAVWPSDGRAAKQQGTSSVQLIAIDPSSAGPAATLETPGPSAEPPAAVNSTPERPRDQHHTWTFGGKDYTLYWGDLHRHTDFSNCRTPDDGCIVDHFRYAYDACGLDYLATTDHTDAGKTYHPYEWWQSQRYADMFQNGPYFLGFYAYEREQRWPYGHRNIVFIDRGGPIVYINKKAQAASPWSALMAAAGPGDKDSAQLRPEQVWRMLRKAGLRTTTIEHTPAGGMGTDWSVYKQIDSKLENVVEIYQGSRNSYEGENLAQPAVAGKSAPMSFGKHKAGTYQNALRVGHKLGVFASSDHRSTGISFGGVYVRKFDRPGVLDAVDARRTLAATDKIFMEFSCNGHMMGEIFTTREKPAMKIAVRGTAPLKAVTIVRNEADYKTFAPKDTASFDAAFTDEKPLAGENRYYLRIEQTDGNMGWTSPVWVNGKK